MEKDRVLCILGPSEPSWTACFKARDEVVWEWRYCDEWNEAARFDVLFDGSKGTVRSSMSQTEMQMGLCEEVACPLCRGISVQFGLEHAFSRDLWFHDLQSRPLACHRSRTNARPGKIFSLLKEGCYALLRAPADFTIWRRLCPQA